MAEDIHINICTRTHTYNNTQTHTHIYTYLLWRYESMCTSGVVGEVCDHLLQRCVRCKVYGAMCICDEYALHVCVCNIGVYMHMCMLVWLHVFTRA